VSGRILLALSRRTHGALWDHLVPRHHVVEEAAFAYAADETADGSEIFRCIEWAPVPPDGFASRSAFRLELADSTRASAIKRAHDLGACLVEFHSHTGRWPAAFSESDLAGLAEFVPHIWWRLKGRPYLAVVVARTGFDGFVWITGPGTPHSLTGVIAGEKVLTPTGLSRWEPEADDRSL
jgi:hypothetical protein